MNRIVHCSSAIYWLYSLRSSLYLFKTLYENIEKDNMFICFARNYHLQGQKRKNSLQKRKKLWRKQGVFLYSEMLLNSQQSVELFAFVDKAIAL